MILAIAFLFLTLLLVVAEVFFTSFGMFGLLAAGSAIASVVLAFQHGTSAGWTLLAVLILLVPITLTLSFKVFPHTPFGRRLILAGPHEAPAAGASAEPALVGRTGRAITPLRPSGVASIDGHRYSVVSEGDHVVADETIEVVAVEGNRIVVRRPAAP